MIWIKCAKQKDQVWTVKVLLLVPNGLWAKYQIVTSWTHNKQWEELPASTYGFLKLPCGQSDKPADRAGRWIEGRKVRSADIYTSVVRERREQAHINRKRWVEGMTRRVDFTKQNLISSSGTTSVKGSWWKPASSERHACWHGEHLCTHPHRKQKKKIIFCSGWFFTTQALFILFYCFNKHEHLASLYASKLSCWAWNQY